MCRHLAYLGPPVDLATLLFSPAHGLVRQAHAPRHCLPGRINADGWGVGWWDPEVGAEPARYRTATPMWADAGFSEVAAWIRAGAAVAAVRNASPGAPVVATSNAPFRAGRWLFSHNGYVEGFRDGLGVELVRSLTPRRAAEVLGATDSEVVFALVLDRLDAGCPAGTALAEVVALLADRAGGKLNLLLGDGSTVWATAWSNSLFTLADDAARIVASEPSDDDPRWSAVPDRSLVVASSAGIDVRPL